MTTESNKKKQKKHITEVNNYAQVDFRDVDVLARSLLETNNLRPELVELIQKISDNGAKKYCETNKDLLQDLWNTLKLFHDSQIKLAQADAKVASVEKTYEMALAKQSAKAVIDARNELKDYEKQIVKSLKAREQALVSRERRLNQKDESLRMDTDKQDKREREWRQEKQKNHDEYARDKKNMEQTVRSELNNEIKKDKKVQDLLVIISELKQKLVKEKTNRYESEVDMAALREENSHLRATLEQRSTEKASIWNRIFG